MTRICGDCLLYNPCPCGCGLGVCESSYSPYQNEYVFAMMAACKRDAKPPCAKSSGFKRRTIEDVLFDYAANSLTLEEAAAELRGMMEGEAV